MLRYIRSCGFVALLLIAAASLSLAQAEFSADIVDTAHPDRATKVYSSKDKMRFESHGDARDGGGSFIMNLSTQTYLVIMDKQQMYMEMPATAMERRGMFSFFKSGDVENACPDWAKLRANEGGTCHKDGHETVNGRDTIKYSGTNAKGESTTAWIDAKLRFPVKWTGKNGGGEMRNIQEGSQPDSLFVPPAGYTKMDMSGMMPQHK